MIFFLGLMVGNFVYQAFVDQSWLDAVRISFIQGVAIFGYWFFHQRNKP